MKKDELLKMNLQFFAESPAGDEPPADDNPGDGGEPPKGSVNSEVNLPQTQAELDAAINKANQKAIENARKGMFTKEDVQAEIQKALKKEKDYGELSESERREKELEDKEKALEAKEAEFNFNKRVQEIQGDLINKKLPMEFAELIAKGTESNEQALGIVSEIETKFNEAVAAQVKESLKQPTPGAHSASGKVNSLGKRLAQGKQNYNGQIFKED